MTNPKDYTSTDNISGNPVINTSNATGTEVKEINYSVERSESFSGPLPSPNVLRGYSEILPDAPERILKMAEIQMQHDIEMDLQNIEITKQGMKEGADSAKRGQYLAFIIGIILIACGMWLTIAGFTEVGMVIFSTTLAAVVGVFLTVIIKKSK